MNPRIENTLRDWKLVAWANGTLHYVVGIAGLILAPLASSAIIEDANLKQGLGIAAGLCIALVTFLQPRETSLKFWNSYRDLKTAQLKYAAKAKSLQGEKDEKALLQLVKAFHDVQPKIEQDSRSTPVQAEQDGE